MIPDPDDAKKKRPYRVFVVGCEKCRVTRTDKGEFNIDCDATLADNPKGHPPVVMEMERIDDA